MGLITESYGGLQEVHAWCPPDNSEILYKLNDLSVRPQVKVTDISGLHSLPEMEDNREDHIGRRGQTIYPSYERSRTIVYTAVVRARSVALLDAVRGALRRNFRVQRDREGTMRIGANWFYRARVAALEISDVQTTGPESVYPFQRDVTLTLIQSDPRVYWHLPQIFTGLDNEEVLEVNNIYGTTDSDPIITVENSGSVVTLENFDVPGATSGHARLRFNDLPDGTLTVDFLHRTAEVNGVDVTAKLASTTDWWDDGKVGIDVGNNSIKVTAEADSTWSLLYYIAH